MAVFNTVLPYILYTHGLLGVDSTSAPIIATLEPAVAAIIGMLFYGEKPGFTGTAGMILILISVVILNMKLQTELKLRANAKINLSLYIKGKRDDGYHLIDTVMQSVNLCDEITVKKSEEISVKCSEGEIAEKDNIAFKAAELFFSLEKLRSLRFLQNPKKRDILFFLLFLLPGTPKDLLCYFAGLTEISTASWICIQLLGRIPSILTSTLGGDALGSEKYWIAAIVLTATAVISWLGLAVYHRFSSQENQKHDREQQK